MEKNSFLFILGAERSGIALTSDCFRLSLSDQVFIQNEIFYENIHHINYTLTKKLKCIQGTFYAYFDKYSYQVIDINDDKIIENAIGQISHLIACAQAESKHCIMLKGSLFCYCLPFWINILREMEINTQFVHVIRHPHEVAMFLEKENQTPILNGHLIWLSYVRKVLENLKGYEVFTIGFDQLLADPVTTLKNCHTSLGLPPISTDKIQNLIEHVQPVLKNYHVSAMPKSHRQRFAPFSKYYDQLRAKTFSFDDARTRIDPGKRLHNIVSTISDNIDNNESFLDFAYEVISEYEENELKFLRSIKKDSTQDSATSLALTISLPTGNSKFSENFFQLFPDQWQKIALPVTQPKALHQQPVFIRFSTTNYTIQIQSISMVQKVHNRPAWSLTSPSDFNLLMTDGPCLFNDQNHSCYIYPLKENIKIFFFPLKLFNDEPLDIEIWIKPFALQYNDIQHFLNENGKVELLPIYDQSLGFSKECETKRLVELARNLRHANNFLSAEKLLLKVLDWNENEISALKELAENNFLRKGVTKTVEICERIYSILSDKTDDRTFQLLAGSLRALKKYENAEYYLLKGLQLFPRSKAILQEYAELFMSQKQWNLAVEGWNKLLNLYPDYSFAKFRLGNAYESNDDYKSAVSLYKEALKTGKPNVLWSNQLNITSSKYAGVIDVFPSLDDVSIHCPICLEKTNLIVTSFPTCTQTDLFFSKLPVLFCNKCGSGFVPDADKLLSDYYKNQYSKQNRRDRDIQPEEYFGENAQDKYPSLKHYFERSLSQTHILRKHGAVFNRVLDYGSGPGYFLKICGAKELYAVDPDRNSEKYLYYINAKIIENDELPTDFFDVVVASHVVEHFDAKNAINIIRAILQSLKKNGLLLVEVPQGGHSYLYLAHPHHAPHTIFFTPEGILKLMENAGAEIIDAFPRDMERCYPRNPSAIYKPDINNSFLSTQHECLTVLAKPKIDSIVKSKKPDSLVTIFFHIPFSGGTSISTIISSLYESKSIFNINRRGGLPAIEKLYSMSDDSLTNIKHIHLHHPYPVDMRTRKAIYFTVLRDPVSRFLSGFYKKKNLGEKIMLVNCCDQQKNDIENILFYFEKNNMDNSITRQIAVLHDNFSKPYFEKYNNKSTYQNIKYEENLFYWEATSSYNIDDLYEIAVEVIEDKFFQPGIFDYLHASYYLMLINMNINLEIIPKLPHLGRSHKPTGTDEIPTNIIDRIKSLNSIDQRLYTNFKSQFEVKYKEIISSFKDE